MLWPAEIACTLPGRAQRTFLSARENLMTTMTYHVPNISCGHCTATIERELKFVDGVEQVHADQASKDVTVDVRAEEVLRQVEALLAEIGYPAEVA